MISEQIFNSKDYIFLVVVIFLFVYLFLFSAADLGELLKREVGHQSAGHVYRWQAAGPRPHHHNGNCADLQG